MKKNTIKRRIYDTLVVNGASLHAIFDPGAQNSYITKSALTKLHLQPQPIGYTYRVGLGGKKQKIKEEASFLGKLHGFSLHLRPYLIDALGKSEEGKEIDLLFGILDMEKWGVELDIEHKKLDLSYLRKEFVEFYI